VKKNSPQRRRDLSALAEHRESDLILLNQEFYLFFYIFSCQLVAFVVVISYFFKKKIPAFVC